MKSSLLPIGSIVSLYKNNTKLMIVGYLQKTQEDNKVWDYSAIPYPNGFISPNRMVVFDNIQIERTYYVGYMNLENIEFLKELEQKNLKEEVEILW